MNFPKILFLSTQLPYPPKSGGTIKSWNYLKDLTRRYQVSLACLLKGDDEEFIPDFQKNISLEGQLYFPLNLKRSALTLLRSYFGFPCLNVYRNYSKEFEQKVGQLSLGHDLIIVDHYEVFQYIPNNFRGKVVLHTHNAEFMLWQRMADLEKNPIKKWLLMLEAKRVKNYEIKLMRQADLVYATPSDIDIYQKHHFDVSRHRPTFHLGNEELLALPKIDFEATELAFTFVGTLTWEPNIDGICWFLKEVWPKIMQKHAKAKLYIIGKSPDQRIQSAAMQDQSVVFTGFVKDLEQFFQKTRIYIVPLRFGSGMKVKVLEGLYRGIPMVTTPVGAEGLKLKHREETMIADDAVAFSAACLELVENRILWETLSRKSRVIASEKYTWQPLFEQMDKELKKM